MHKKLFVFLFLCVFVFSVRPVSSFSSKVSVRYISYTVVKKYGRFGRFGCKIRVKARVLNLGESGEVCVYISAVDNSGGEIDYTIACGHIRRHEEGIVSGYMILDREEKRRISKFIVSEF